MKGVNFILGFVSGILIVGIGVYLLMIIFYPHVAKTI
jgi:hypothetical protein